MRTAKRVIMTETHLRAMYMGGTQSERLHDLHLSRWEDPSAVGGERNEASLYVPVHLIERREKREFTLAEWEFTYFDINGSSTTKHSCSLRGVDRVFRYCVEAFGLYRYLIPPHVMATWEEEREKDGKPWLTRWLEPDVRADGWRKVAVPEWFWNE